MRWAAAIFICVLAGCRHQPLAYSLRQEGRTAVLTPPSSKPEIKNARSHPRQKTGCDIEEKSFSVAWHGNTARVGVKAEDYYAPPPPPAPPRPQGADPTVSIAESGERIFVDPLAQLEIFREALMAREESGCFRDEEGARLREAITEAFPFPPQIASFVRFGTYQRSGFDLTPGFVLRLVSPTGGAPDVSFYGVERVPGEGRVRIMLTSGAGRALTAPETPEYFRYLYWTGGSTHNFRTTILGVPERKMMADATGRFLAEPEGYCAKPGTGVFCQSVAVTVGMNAGFYVRINDKDVFVRLGGQLAEAVGESASGLRPAGRRVVLPANATVRRMFHGKLIPVKADGSNVLFLVAMPGDEVRFSP